MMRRLAFALVLVPVLSGLAGAETLPRPAALEHQVAFWRRVYAEVDTGGGLIHDSRRLDVVYEVIRLPQGLSRRARERRVKRAKRRHIDALVRLSKGKRTGLDPTETHVLAQWPEGVSNRTLRAAASRVRFQLGQADKFRAGVIRSGRWEPHIRDVFARHGLPREIAALPHVESSFNPRAYSSAGAAGLWQFTRSTGRRYMRVDYVVDERLDPHKATVAAARLLLDNYESLRSWPLAITAYNHGAAGMRRAVRKLGTRDMARIVERYKSRSFGFASRNFYTELLAAIDVERDAERYFGPLLIDPPLQYQRVELEHYYRVSSLAQAFGISIDDLREHNLSLRPSVWRGQKYVPRGFVVQVPVGGTPEPARTLVARIPAGERYTAQKRDTVYVVQRGDTLSRIARRFGVSERELVALNGLRSRHRIRVGQRLRLPARDGPTLVAAEFDGSYRVRRGDTLSSIAQRFGVRAIDLAAANGVRNRDLLRVGQVLKVPAPAPSQVAAAAPPKPAPTPQPSPPKTAGPPEPSPPKTAGPPEPSPPKTAGPPPAARPGVAEPPAAPDPTPQPRALAAAPSPPPVVVSSPDAAPPRPMIQSSPHAAAAATPASLPEIDYAVDPRGRITVEANETLGHYAEWLEIPTQRLRDRNGLRYGRSLAIGQRIELDLSRVSPDVFRRRRQTYHAELAARFFSHYRVAGTQVHVLKRGDTLWSLSKRHRAVPLWLLRRYNPELDLGNLRPGERIRIPQVERRTT